MLHHCCWSCILRHTSALCWEKPAPSSAAPWSNISSNVSSSMSGGSKARRSPRAPFVNCGGVSSRSGPSAGLPASLSRSSFAFVAWSIWSELKGPVGEAPKPSPKGTASPAGLKMKGLACGLRAMRARDAVIRPVNGRELAQPSPSSPRRFLLKAVLLSTATYEQS